MPVEHGIGTSNLPPTTATNVMTGTVTLLSNLFERM